MVQDYKLIANKVIAKGELLLRTLYSTESGEDGPGSLETMENSIPISQIIDLDGVDEECGCDVKFVPGFVKAEPKQDGDGENKLIGVSLTVTASARAWRTEQHYAACDAYSPQYEMNIKTKEIGFEHMAEHVKANEIVRQTIDPNGMEISSIINSGAKANVTGVGFEDGALVISGEMALSLFAVDQTGSPTGIEKSMPFSIKEELKNASDVMRCEPEVSVVSTSYSISGEGGIDMRVECAVEAMVYSISRENAIVEMSLDEENPKDSTREKTLTLYYADKGERIWDIAKRYNTSMDAVKRENNLETDSLEERSMLLIPKKHAAHV